MSRDSTQARCPHCHSPRTLVHPELFDLKIAHIDCDAFYASVEKHDNPELATKPVIVGGEQRGVVTTACYIARIRGVRSAMPMFQAKRLCPDAIIIKPRMARYREVSYEIRKFYERMTDIVEPLSLDEAYLDLSHCQNAALALVNVQREVKSALGITLSVGLSHNRYLSKLASDFQKPNGFFVIGKADTDAFLTPLPVRKIPGVGPKFSAKLERAGIYTIADVKLRDEAFFMKKYGASGQALWARAHGKDRQRIGARAQHKSLSTETTFFHDIADCDTLRHELFKLCKHLLTRMESSKYTGQTVVLKATRADFQKLSRQKSAGIYVQTVEDVSRVGFGLLDKILEEAPFRLLGIGISNLVEKSEAYREADLFSQMKSPSAALAERLRKELGKDAPILAAKLK